MNQPATAATPEQSEIMLADVKYVHDHVGAVVKQIVVGYNSTGGQSVAIEFEDGDMLMTSVVFGVDGETGFSVESYLKKERAGNRMPEPGNALPM